MTGKTMARDIAVEILEGLDDAAAHLDGLPANARVTTVKSAGTGGRAGRSAIRRRLPG
jgi:hypothetical protein